MALNWRLFGATLIPNVGGWAGSVITRHNIKPWYESLNKPSFTPPNWAFGPVWTGLYCSVGYASYLVYCDGGGFNGPAKLPLIVYGSNLVLNWAWTPIFFGAKNTKLALYEINLVTATAAATGYLFYQVNKTAGLLFIPYILWLGLATALNYRVYKDNPDESKIKEIKE